MILGLNLNRVELEFGETYHAWLSFVILINLGGVLIS